MNYFKFSHLDKLLKSTNFIQSKLINYIQRSWKRIKKVTQFAAPRDNVLSRRFPRNQRVRFHTSYDPYHGIIFHFPLPPAVTLEIYRNCDVSHDWDFSI